MLALDYSQDIYYLGSRIRDERASRGMSQEDLAEAMDMAVSTLYRIENGKTSVPITALLCAAEVLQVSVSDLLPPRFELKDIYCRQTNKNPKEAQIEQAIRKLNPRDKKVVYNTVSALVDSLLV